jgi:hypothetical protein
MPARAQSPLVFARYSISCLSIWLLVLSFGIDDLYSKIRSLYGISKHTLAPALILVVFLFFASILFTNPIIRLYLTRSNFTNHHDFINPSYKDFVAIYKSKLDLIPRFYLELKEEMNATQIIEMPPKIVWTHINYHLYQQIHRKKVTIGYSMDVLNSYSSPFAHKRIKFKNLFNIDNIESLTKSDYKYVVIHHDIIEEALRMRKSLSLDFTIKSVEEWRFLEHSYARNRPLKESRVYIDNLQRVFGEPYFKDKWITVFRIM